MTDIRSGYSMDEHLRPIIDGKVVLPNFKEVPVRQAVSIVACYSSGSVRGNARVPGADHTTWAQFFLEHGQGGGLTGRGHVLLYGPASGGLAGTFAICEHEKVDDPGADHNRGWHPGHCKKCGLDMTVDSGD